MTTTPPASPPPRDPRLTDELAGVVLLVLGVVALVVAAAAWDWRAGLAVTGAALVCGGMLLAVDASED